MKKVSRAGLLTNLLILFIVAGCANVAVHKATQENRKILDRVSHVCAQQGTNVLLVEQKCLPLLDDKELLVTVDSVRKENEMGHESPDGQLVVRGSTSHAYVIFCKPSESVARTIFQNPASIEIGKPYLMKGKAVKYQGGYIERFTLKNCDLKPWVQPKVTQ